MSRLSEQRRLEMDAKMLNQKSQVEIEEKAAKAKFGKNVETNGDGKELKALGIRGGSRNC